MASNNSQGMQPLSQIISDPIRNFKFLVKFLPKGLPDAYWLEYGSTFGFMSVSGLSIATESIAYREGGYNTNVHQIPGQTSFQPITLSKGVMLGQSANANWMKRLFSVLTDNTAFGIPGGSATGAATTFPSFRADLDIQVLSHPNPRATTGSDSTATVTDPATAHTSLRFYVYNAWITSLTYSNLDAGANAFMVEDMTIVHEGFDVKYGTDLTTAGSAKDFANGTGVNIPTLGYIG